MITDTLGRSRSYEEPVESWDDVRNRFNDLLKRPVHRFSWHRDILQRYVDGDLALHLHVALQGGGLLVLLRHEASGVGRVP